MAIVQGPASATPATTSVPQAPVAAAAGAPGSTVYQAVTPLRVLNPTTLGAGASTNLTLPGVPAGATAVQLNITASAATTVTYVSACAGGTALSTCRATSALNPTPGVDTPAAALVTLGGAGNAITLYNNAGSVRLMADVQGYYLPAATSPGSMFVPTTPYRALDTRVGAALTQVVTFPEAPIGATAVALNLTASGATQTTFVSVCPTGSLISTCKQSSALNPSRGVDAPNLVIAKLGGSGNKQISLYNNAGATRLIADVQGYFVDAGIAVSGASYLQPVTPERVLTATSMGTQQSYTLTLSNVPAKATAVAMNVTSTAASRVSFVSACPAGLSTPTCIQSSTLNPRPGADTANNVFLKLGGVYGNQVTLYNNAGATRLIADVQGYFVDPNASSAPVPTAPANPTGGVPGPDNTGAPTATPLSVHQGDLLITQNGAVIDSLDVNGFITVAASGVTIRNTIVRGGAASSPRALVMVNGASYSATIIDSTLVATTASPWINGVNGSNFTLDRVEISNVIDQVHIYGNNVTVQNSWLHSNAHFGSDPVHGGGASHDDNIQIQSGSGITIRNNSISGSHNAAIMLTQDSGAVANLTLEANTLDNGACTVNVKNSATAPSNVTLSSNVFGRTSSYSGCALKMPNTSYSLNLIGNVYTDGNPIAVTR